LERYMGWGIAAGLRDAGRHHGWCAGGVTTRKVTLRLVVIVLVVGAFGTASAVSADLAHPFAGTWKTFSGKGRLGLEVVSPSKGAKAVAFYSAVSGTPVTCRPSVVYYTGYYQVSGDSGQIAGCTTDATGRELTAWYKSGAGEQHGTVDITINSDDTSFKGTYRELSNHSEGSYSGTLIPAAGILVGSPVGLLDTEVLRATPAGASNYKFEIKRSSDATWTLLASRASATYQFVARIPGHFQVRAIATVNGKAETSAPQDLEVQFPSWDTVASDEAVIKDMIAAWEQTIADTNAKTGVQELGFWIRLDTCTGNYSATRTIQGTRRVPMPPPSLPPDVDLGSPPATTPANPRLLGCASYTVAGFHTHTGTEYWKFGKKVGPSINDERLALRQGVPGLIYDYLPYPGDSDPPTIPGGYPLEGKAKVYHDGPSRRETPT
jgi:hypothetical protein